MLPASNRGVGNAIATPDVCMTPDGTGGSQPIPYTNTSNNAQATGYSETVKVSMMNAMNTATTIPSSSGDEAGTYSSTQGKTSYTMGDVAVYVDGMPAIELCSPTTQNGTNAVGSVLVPSLTTVFFSFAAAPPAQGAADRWTRRLDADDARALGRVVAPRDGAMHAEMVDASVGLVRVDAFTEDAHASVLRAIRRLEDAGARALVLDLRGCAGGDFDAAVRLAGEFLPAGAVIARVTDLDGDVGERVANASTPCALPLVVLVDGGTASAAEAFAGALQAHARALVIGRRTYGKGAIQAVERSPQGLVAATQGYVSLCDGRAIEDHGIEPDAEMADDAALDAACALCVELSRGATSSSAD